MKKEGVVGMSADVETPPVPLHLADDGDLEAPGIELQPPPPPPPPPPLQDNDRVSPPKREEAEVKVEETEGTAEALSFLEPGEVAVGITQSDSDPPSPAAGPMSIIDWRRITLEFCVAAVANQIQISSSKADPNYNSILQYCYTFAMLFAAAAIAVGSILGPKFPVAASVANKAGVCMGAAGFVVAISNPLPPKLRWAAWALYALVSFLYLIVSASTR